MSIGKRIKARRKELHMSADELGERLGKDRATIYRYESEDIEKIPVNILAPIAKALGVSINYLLGIDNVPLPSNSIGVIEKNQSEDNQKVQTKQEVLEIIMRIHYDDCFYSVLQSLAKLDKKQLNGVKKMLDAFVD